MEMISKLRLPLLSTPRYVSCLMVKMQRGMVEMQCSSLLVTHPHDLHEYLPYTFVSLDSFPLKLHYSNSIFPRTLTKWNSLDSSLKPFPPVKEAEGLTTLSWQPSLRPLGPQFWLALLSLSPHTLHTSTFSLSCTLYFLSCTTLFLFSFLLSICTL